MKRQVRGGGQIALLAALRIFAPIALVSSVVLAVLDYRAGSTSGAAVCGLCSIFNLAFCYVEWFVFQFPPK